MYMPLIVSIWCYSIKLLHITCDASVLGIDFSNRPTTLTIRSDRLVPLNFPHGIGYMLQHSLPFLLRISFLSEPFLGTLSSHQNVELRFPYHFLTAVTSFSMGRRKIASASVKRITITIKDRSEVFILSNELLECREAAIRKARQLSRHATEALQGLRDDRNQMIAKMSLYPIVPPPDPASRPSLTTFLDDMIHQGDTGADLFDTYTIDFSLFQGGSVPDQTDDGHSIGSVPSPPTGDGSAPRNEP
jgi:hypothetical protein